MTNSSELHDWANLVATWRPLEQLALIGLTQLDPALRPNDIEVARVVGEEKCRSASDWLSTHIRPLLYGYCDFCARAAIPIGGKSAETMSLIAALASLLMATNGINAAPAVAFAAWALQAGVKLWCEQYGKVSLDGFGVYEIETYAYYDGDFPNTPARLEIRGAYSVSFFPAITQSFKDETYPHPLHAVEIKANARAEGHFMPSDASFLTTISDYAETKHRHQFSFRDTRSRRTLSGGLDAADVHCSSSDVSFITADVILTGA